MKLFSATVLSVMLVCAVSLAAQGQAKPVAATPENAAAFLGDWIITAKGSYGDLTVNLTLKAADGKVAGEASDTNGKHAIGDVAKSGNSLVASYVFDYQGMPIDAVITLTPNDKNVDAALDFANGAAQFVGTAAKK